MDPQQLDYLKTLALDIEPNELHAGPLTRSLESVHGLDEARVEAVSANLESIRAGGELSLAVVPDLEAIIHETRRPAMKVVDDVPSFDNPHWSFLRDRRFLEGACKAVGRVELRGGPKGLPYVGTGVMVTPTMLLTNRHVAHHFVTGVGDRRVAFRTGLSSEIDLQRDHRRWPEPLLLSVEKVLLVHPYWDLAVLEIRGFAELGRAPLSLLSAPVTNNRAVAIIGHPAEDPGGNVALQAKIFGPLFERKFLQPGILRRLDAEVRSFDRVVQALDHDCSTLGGNSGSPLLDLETGDIVGLHFAGAYLRANYAVPAWQLARDPRLVDLGLFEALAGGQSPLWLEAWSWLDESPTPESAGSSVGLEDLFTHLDDDALMTAMRQDRRAVRDQLTALVGADEAHEIIDDLEAIASADQEAPADAAERPEIIYLHGILGSNLRGQAGRVWLAALPALGELADRLTLDEEGYDPDEPLFPDGHLWPFYNRARRKWRRAGYTVHDYSFDWRKDIELSARQLKLFIDNLALARPGRRFALVAHSMGGVVSATYSRMFSDHCEQHIKEAVFVGSPIGGAFAPVEAVVGSYPFLKALAWAAPAVEQIELREMAASLPGMLQMLPNPAFFDTEQVFEEGFWVGVVPDDGLLAASRTFSDALRDSPLLQRCKVLATVDRGTVADLNGGSPGPRKRRGDSTVPARSAAPRFIVEDGRAWKVSSEHSRMMNDSDVIRGVKDILSHGAPQRLPKLRVSELSGDVPGLESPVDAEGVDAPAGIKGRLENKHLLPADIRWLFSGEAVEMPADRRVSGFSVRSLTPGRIWRVDSAPLMDPRPALEGAVETTLSYLVNDGYTWNAAWALSLTLKNGTAPRHEAVRVTAHLPSHRGEDRLLLKCGDVLGWAVSHSDGQGERVLVGELELPEGEAHVITAYWLSAPLSDSALESPLGRLTFRRRLRSWTPTDYKRKSPQVTYGPRHPIWERLAAAASPRVLLVLHGTGKQSHRGFDQFTEHEIQKLHDAYDAVFALDHWVLQDSVLDNVETLAASLPKTPISLNIDILSVSRGGLVGRAIAQKHPVAVKHLHPHTLTVKTLVMVGTSNLGTEMADGVHLAALLKTSKLANEHPEGIGAPDSDFEAELTIAKYTSRQPLFPGRRDFIPNSALLNALNRAPPLDIAYRLVTCDSEARYAVIDAVLDPPHDQLITRASIEGIWRPEAIPIPGAPKYDVAFMRAGTRYDHHHYFWDDAVRTRILEWLGAN